MNTKKQILHKEATEKDMLISSMQKLAKYVKKSREKQEEIFNSLSQSDFRKILSYLDDGHQVLRKISINLVAEIIADNVKLKYRFCRALGIGLVPGKVVFNLGVLQKHASHSDIASVLNLVKNSDQRPKQSGCLLWYVRLNVKKMQPKIEYIYKKPESVLMQINVDPHECLVGVSISQGDLSTEFSTSTISVNTQNEQSQKWMANSSQSSFQKTKAESSKRINDTEYLNVEQQISSHDSKVATKNQAASKTSNAKMSVKSDSQPKYQRMNRNTFNPSDNDRPRRVVMNNYISGRKHSSFRGHETERPGYANTSLIYPESTKNGHFHRENAQKMPTQHLESRISRELKTSQTNDSQRQPFPNMSHSFQVNSLTPHQVPSLQLNSSQVSGSINQQTATQNYQSRTIHTDRVAQTPKVTTNEQSPFYKIDFQKIKYQNGVKYQQGIKVTSPASSSGSINRSSFAFGERNQGLKVSNVASGESSFEHTFKYIKPITATNRSHQQCSFDHQGAKYEGVKFVNFFSKRQETPATDRKTIDVQQYIHNR